MAKSHPHPHRILMVDDDTELRTMLGQALAGEGYVVNHADNSNDAILLHNQQPYDLIIAEVILDHKDGFKTLLQLRRHSAPVKIIATAKEHRLSTSLFLRMAKHLGAHSVLSKPFEPEQLMTAVQNVLNGPR